MSERAARVGAVGKEFALEFDLVCSLGCRRRMATNTFAVLASRAICAHISDINRSVWWRCWGLVCKFAFLVATSQVESANGTVGIRQFSFTLAHVNVIVVRRNLGSIGWISLRHPVAIGVASSSTTSRVLYTVKERSSIAATARSLVLLSELMLHLSHHLVLLLNELEQLFGSAAWHHPAHVVHAIGAIGSRHTRHISSHLVNVCGESRRAVIRHTVIGVAGVVIVATRKTTSRPGRRCAMCVDTLVAVRSDAMQDTIMAAIHSLSHVAKHALLSTRSSVSVSHGSGTCGTR